MNNSLKHKAIAIFTILLVMGTGHVMAQSPGGVSSNIHLWLRADQQAHSTGNTLATDGQAIDNWSDQSGNGFNAVDNGGVGPDWNEDALNFNPGLDFVRASSEDLQILGGISEGVNKPTYFVYYVAKADLDVNSNIFYEALGSARYFNVHYPWSNENLYWDYGNKTDNQGRIFANWGSSYGTFNLWGLVSSSDAATPNSTRKYLIRDNIVFDSNNSNTGRQGLGIGNNFNIGSIGTGNFFDGTLCEAVIYDGMLSATQEDQVQSYLAIKYGITLNNSNYLNSSAEVIWTSGGGFDNDIAGIGRDNGSGLNQKQSKSKNNGAIVTMSTEAIAATNATNGTDITDGALLLWGNSGATTSAGDNLPTGFTARLDKEWMIEMTGTVSDVHVEFDLTGMDLQGDAATDYVLLIDADGDFKSGATEITASSFTANKATFNDVNFTDGQYFTIATKQSGPGGVSTDLLVWLKADAGTNTTTEDANVTTWNDQGTKGFNADDQGGNGPDYLNNGINFNPALDFATEDLRIPGGVCEGETKDGYFFYIVSQSEGTGNHAILRQNLNSSKFLIFRHVGTAGTGADAYYGNGTNNEGRFYGTHNNDPAIARLWSIGSDAFSNATPNGTRRYISRDNTVIKSNNASSNVRGTSTNDMYIGSNYGSNNWYDGRISEIIIIDDIPTAQEEDKIQSYLAIKYGITLNSMNYINSSSTTIWTNGGGFDNDIAGIGRDDLAGLHQKQSKSVESDAIVTMSTEAIAANNTANGTSLTDGAFLVWGNDNNTADANADLPGGYNTRLKKEWKVKMTGTVSNVHVEFDITGLGLSGNVAGDFTLLQDADGDFTSGATAVVASSFASDKVTIENVNFSDGQYFTLASSVIPPAPAAVSTNLQYWVKANSNTNTTTNGAEVTSWTDIANTVTNTGSAGNVPTYVETGINHNPSLNFSGSSQFLTVNDLSNLPSGATQRSLFIVGRLGIGDNNYRFAFGHGENAIGEAHGFGQNSTALDADYEGRSSNVISNDFFVVDDAFIGSGYYSGTHAVIAKDGELRDSTARSWNTDNAAGGSVGYVGRWVNGGLYWKGEIAEIIAYDKRLNSLERLRVSSYLAIKYGISLTADNNGNSTLGETISGSVTEGDYVDRDGTTIIWDYSAHTGYQNGIAGIGRNQTGGSTLHQKQSTSSDPNAILTISTQAIASINASNSTNVTEGAYLLWGHNGAVVSDAGDLPTGGGYTGRLAKEWVVEMTGTVSNVHVEFDLSGNALAGDAAGDFFLLTDADGDFTSGATATAASSFSGGKVTFDDFTFTDGQYFTIATKQAGPGGVASNLKLWLRADEGVTGSTPISGWADQSGGGYAAVAGGPAPDLTAAGMNFNPSLTFASGSNEYLKIVGGLYGTKSKYSMFAYVALQNGSGTNHPVFGETLAGSEYFMFLTNWGGTPNSYWGNGNNAAPGRINKNPWSGSTTEPTVWAMGSHSSTSTPAGKFQYLKVDNTVLVSDDTYDNSVTGANNDFQIGKWQTSASEFNGEIAEIVILDGVPSAAEENRIQSYLAVKYGTTLNGMNYTSSNETVIWNNATYSAYQNDLGGIGRDIKGGLNQKQSKSQSTDAIVTMSTEAIAADNNTNSTSLTDGAYLLWGNDNDDNGTIELIGSELPVGYTQRLDREWVVEKTGTVSNVHLQFDIAGLGMEGSTASNFTLLTDADGDFSAGAVATVATSFVADKVTFDDFTFTDGQYFTLVTNGGAGIKLLGTSDLEITHDDQSPRAEDGTSFGVVPAASGSVVRTFKVINTGGSVLTVTNIDIKSRGGNGNEYDAHYTVNDSTTLSVAAGDTGIFKVTFDPTAAVWAGRNDNSGNKMAYVQIVSNSLNGNHEYDIHGTGVGGSPFTCTTGDMILVHRNPSDFYRNDYTDPDLGVSTLRTDQGVFLDGVGINPVDSFMYGMRRDANRFQLWVVADDGIRQFRGIVAGLTDVSNHAVDFATDGYLYMKEAGTNTTFHKVDVQAMTSTDITLSQSSNFNDMAYNPIDGKFYAESTAGVVGLISIVPSTGVVTLIANGNIAATHGVYGNSLGNIYGQAVSGQVFEWDLTDGSEVAVTNDPAGYNLEANQYDGAGCGPYKLGYPVISTTDAATVITCDSTYSGGNITFVGHPITAHGLCWSTSSNPTTSDSKSDEGAGSAGAFTSWITGTSSGTTYYVRAYATNKVGTVYGPEVSYTTMAGVTAGSIDAAQSICYNSTPDELTETTSATGGDGTFTYTWQSSTDNTNWTTIIGATQISYTPSALTTSTYFRRRAASSNCDTAATASILITVYDDLTPGAISILEDTICSGATPITLNDATSPTGGTGSYTFQWEISTTDPGTSGYSNISGATGITYSPSSALTQDTWYRRKTTSDTCGTVTTDAQKIEVSAPLVPGEIGW